MDSKIPIESLGSGIKKGDYIYSPCGNKILKINIADGAYSTIDIKDSDMVSISANPFMLDDNDNIIFGVKGLYYYWYYWTIQDDKPVKTNFPVFNVYAQNSKKEILGVVGNHFLVRIHNNQLDTVFNLNDVKPSFYISNLLVDKNGAIWFCCQKLMTNPSYPTGPFYIGKYLSGAFKFWSEDDGLPENPNGGAPYLDMDQYGDIWYTRSNVGICRINSDGLQAFPFDKMNPSNLNPLFTKVLIDNNNKIWLVYENSTAKKYKIYKFDYNKNSLEAFSEDEYSKFALTLYSSVIDNNGNLLVACDSGTVSYEKGKWVDQQFFYKTDGFKQFVKMPDGTISIGTQNHGLFYNDTHTWENFDPGKGIPICNTNLFEFDREGEIWFPVLAQGILIAGIYSKSGTRRKVYYGLNDKAKLIKILFNKKNDPIFVTDYGIYDGADSSRLYRINDSLNIYRSFANAVIDSNDHIWLHEQIKVNGVTYDELYEFADKKFILHLSKKFSDYSPDKLFIGIPRQLAVDRENHLWGAFSSESGKYLVEFDGEKWIKPAIQEPFPVSGSYNPLCIATDDSLGVWVGFNNFTTNTTELYDNYSLATYYRDGKSTVYTGLDKFSDIYQTGNITDIAVYKNYVWFATGVALFLLDKTDDSFTKFSFKEGINSHSISKIEMFKNGTLWVSGDNGFNTVIPQSSISVGEKKSDYPTFKLYPNPARNIINIDLPENISPKQITICDISGKEVLQLGYNATSADISSLPAGNYLLVVESDKNYTLAKVFTIER